MGDYNTQALAGINVPAMVKPFSGVFLPPTPVTPPPPTPTPPTISNVLPAPGTPIYPNAVLALDVTDDSSSFRVIVLNVSFPDGAYEVVYDGQAFAKQYELSSKSGIPSGFHFDVVRSGGWPASPTLHVIAVDPSGNAA